MINQIEKGILIILLEIILISLLTISSARFNEFDARNVILFHIKVFGRHIKEAMLARYFRKITVRPSSRWLSVISALNIKMESILQKFSCIFYLLRISFKSSFSIKSRSVKSCCMKTFSWKFSFFYIFTEATTAGVLEKKMWKVNFFIAIIQGFSKSRSW